MSSFKGKNIFGSGPHRFAQLRQGHLLLTSIQFDIWQPGSAPAGLIELDVAVTGRLVASGDAALWALRDAVVAELEETPSAGTLVGEDGRVWSGMTFVRWEEAERVDRGRVVSLGYVATFRRFRVGVSLPPPPPTGP